MSTPERRGLGRGLGAIIRDTTPGDPLTVSTDDAGHGRTIEAKLVKQLANVGLDLLEPFKPSHLGYLHLANGAEPLLILRRPCLDQTDPTTAYRLLGGLDRAAADLEHIRYSQLVGVELYFVPSRGPHSAGVHLLGTDRPLDDSTRAAAERRCRAVAHVVHQLHREIEPDALAGISTRTEGGLVVAQAILTDTSGQTAQAESRSDDLATAVAQAMVAARGNGLTHKVTRALTVAGDQHAVLTVLTDAAGQPRLGFTVSDAPPTAVAASAARRAIEG